MKNLFVAFMLFLNTLPIIAAPRDDTETGWGLGGGLLFWGIFIIWTIIELKAENKNKKNK